MAAPTGKAAMRLSSSVSQAVEALLSNSHMSPDVGAEMPISASTLHRLLGVNPSQEQNRFNASNPLPVDVMIVDEASMVDITLMEQLVDALPDACRLILLGDKDQLPSIEAGNVLADLCDQASNSYSHDYCKVLTALGNHGLQSSKRAHSLLMDCTCNLKVSHRFPDLSTIGQLARAINSNDSEATRALVNQAQDATGDGAFCFYELSGRALPIDQMVKAYQAFLDISNNPNSTPLEVIRAFSGYQILCGVRSGDSGVEQLNADLEQALRTAGQIRADRWYHGRPVLVTQNDYGLHLFNGDIGITLVDGNGDAIVYFQSGDETVRKVLPARLPAHQTCWAMTIHKTQGSEYERIAIVLPDKSHLTRLEFLSRELLYTAVTRARQQVTIYGYASELDDILAQSARRSSGLAQRLRGELK
jgi:exodeoxyribonuclease V alpha subunit